MTSTAEFGLYCQKAIVELRRIAKAFDSEIPMDGNLDVSLYAYELFFDPIEELQRAVADKFMGLFEYIVDFNRPETWPFHFLAERLPFDNGGELYVVLSCNDPHGIKRVSKKWLWESVRIEKGVGEIVEIAVAQFQHWEALYVEKCADHFLGVPSGTFEAIEVSQLLDSTGQKEAPTTAIAGSEDSLFLVSKKDIDVLLAGVITFKSLKAKIGTSFPKETKKGSRGKSLWNYHDFRSGIEATKFPETFYWLSKLPESIEKARQILASKNGHSQ